jgi:hypothetical protein
MNHLRMKLESFLESCTVPELLVAFSSKWLNELLPAIRRLHECDQGVENHREGNVAIHTAMVFASLLEVCRNELGREADSIERLSALMHDWKKPDARMTTDDGAVEFPGHEELSAAQCPAVARILGLTDDDANKLCFLVAEHGRAHRFPQLSESERHAIQASPYIESLCALQKADALSCHCHNGGHLPVHWNQMYSRTNCIE